jgi:flagellar basal-body rod protein FlgG
VIQPEIQIPDGATGHQHLGRWHRLGPPPDQVEAQEVGQITLAAFTNPRGLEPIGENFVVESSASGPAVVAARYEDGMGKLVQGALEASNVNVVQELVDMIETQRAYEVNSKSISASDEMMRFLSNKL